MHLQVTSYIVAWRALWFVTSRQVGPRTVGPTANVDGTNKPLIALARKLATDVSAKKAMKFPAPYIPWHFLESPLFCLSTYQTYIKRTRKSNQSCQLFCRHLISIKGYDQVQTVMHKLFQNKITIALYLNHAACHKTGITDASASKVHDVDTKYKYPLPKYSYDSKDLGETEYCDLGACECCGRIQVSWRAVHSLLQYACYIDSPGVMEAVFSIGAAIL